MISVEIFYPAEVNCHVCFNNVFYNQPKDNTLVIGKKISI